MGGRRMDGVPISPITDLQPGPAAEHAYAAQAYDIVDRRIEAGGVMCGRSCRCCHRGIDRHDRWPGRLGPRAGPGRP